MTAAAPMAERYGRLRVLGRSERRKSNGEIYYLCRCDCGETRTVLGRSLRRGATKSCGCLSREISAVARGRRPHMDHVSPVAERYGRLRVLGRSGSSREGEALYRCACACGAVLRVRGKSLRRGHTRSCGCLRAERVSWSGKARAFRRRAALWFRGKRKGEKRS